MELTSGVYLLIDEVLVYMHNKLVNLVVLVYNKLLDNKLVDFLRKLLGKNCGRNPEQCWEVQSRYYPEFK